MDALVEREHQMC